MTGLEGKRVLILGGGASRASEFHLPTMKGFFGDDLSEHPGLEEFLKWFYGDLSRDQYNLEEVLAYLDLSRTRLPLWSTEQRPKYDTRDVGYTEVIEYVRKKLRTPENKICSLHRSLFSQLNNYDTILTFNYDLIADLVLLDVEPKMKGGQLDSDSRMGKLQPLLGKPDLFWGGSPPALLSRELERGFYLKLHGSLDWIHCPRSGCPNNINVWALSVAEIREGQSEKVPCRACGSILQIFLIPPIATKRIDDTGRIAFLWNLALREIREADQIAIIGLSFAPSDFELRWLIRQALELRSPTKRLQVSIVNPNKTDRDSARHCFPKAVFEEFQEIREYIDALTNGRV